MSGEDKQLSGLTEKVKTLFSEYSALPVVTKALKMLESGLSPELCFHSSAHSTNVIKEAIAFALTDNLSEEDMLLLAIAGAYHDTGFLEQPTNNEHIGAAYARRSLEEDGSFTSEQIELVETMILDTRLVETADGPRQIPSCHLSRYLLDADLSNLGRDDFFERSELLRRELGVDQEIFLLQTERLLLSHCWLTAAAESLRGAGQRNNLKRLNKVMEDLGVAAEKVEASGLSLNQILFLNKLPLLLNSSLHTRDVTKTALEHLETVLSVQATTVFMLNEDGSELTFWALQGEHADRLENKSIPAHKGIVGWVIDQQESVMITDATEDPRFFSEIDKEGGFKTKNLICVPLTSGGRPPLGAVQVLNKKGEEPFTQQDQLFVEKFAGHLVLAIENAKLYEALEEKNQLLARLEERKSEMISVISHEFRTPLNVIQASAEMLASGTLQTEQDHQQMGGVLKKGVARLLSLVKQVRNLSLVNSGDIKLSRERVVVGEFLKKVYDQFIEPAQERDLSLSIMSKADSEGVLGDEGLLIIALGNLVSNAIRFTPDGGEITLSASRDSGMIRFAVTDTGIGIEDKEQALIFKKFYEVGEVFQHSSGSFEFKSGGLGIGLATSRAILKGHGASLEVASISGKGSTFFFSLPAVD